MGWRLVLEYVTASSPKNLTPVVSLRNVRLAMVVRVCGTLPCDPRDRVILGKSHIQWRFRTELRDGNQTECWPITRLI